MFIATTYTYVMTDRKDKIKKKCYPHMSIINMFFYLNISTMHINYESPLRILSVTCSFTYVICYGLPFASHLSRLSYSS